MIRDRLVSTGVPAADKYLRAGLDVLPLEVKESAARLAWVEAEERADELNGCRGSAERVQRVAKVFDRRRHELAFARRAERQAKAAALEANAAAADAVEGELNALRRDHNGRQNG